MKRHLFLVALILIFFVDPGLSQSSKCVSGDCENGFGTYVWGVNTKWAGHKYTGNWKKGKQHGQGTYYYSSGSLYKGEWENGSMDGFGEFLWTNGDRFKGNWENGVKHGFGTYYYEDGTIKEGVWENDKYIGKTSNNQTYKDISDSNHQKKMITDSDEAKIGNQTWMRRNLDIDRFRNGDLIFHAKTDEEWEKAGKEGKPAWCYYNNEPANGAKYGKLYNWHAVNDSRGLAPKGWHIPSHDEFTQMINYLGQNAGTKMKSKSGWNNSSNGTNVYDFSGLPAGYRYATGFYVGVGNYGYWWSSTEHLSLMAKSFGLGYDDTNVKTGSETKNAGLSVRCVKTSGTVAGNTSSLSKSSGCVSGDCSNGYGTYVYDNGDKYTGSFKSNYRHGQGTYLYKNENKYSGSWEKGQRTGYGIFYYKGGIVEHGVWENNKLIKKDSHSRYHDYGGRKKNLYVDEQFNNNTNKWKLSTTEKEVLKMEKGYYYMENKDDFLLPVWQVKGTNLDESKNYQIEASIKIVKGSSKSNIISLIFGSDNRMGGNDYRFSIDGLQTFKIGKYDGSHVTFVDISNEIIKANVYNKMTIRKLGIKWYFFINEVLVHSMAAQKVFGSGVGFRVGPNSAALIDYLTIHYLN